MEPSPPATNGEPAIAHSPGRKGPLVPLALRHPHLHLPSRVFKRLHGAGEGKLPLRAAGNGITDDNGVHVIAFLLTVVAICAKIMLN